jgi:hypothetical protein
MSPLVGVDGGDPYQTMDAALRLEVPVGIQSSMIRVTLFRPATSPSTVSMTSAEIASSFCPSEVHAEEHGNPVAGFRAA